MRKDGLADCLGRRISEESFEIGGFCTVEALSLPYSAERLEKMRGQRAAAAVSRAADILRRRGIEKIVFSEALKKYSDGAYPRGRDVFYRFIPMCVREVAPMCGICLHRASVGIADGNSGRISEYLIHGLYRDVRTVRLYTQNDARARSLCRQILDETGMPATYIIGKGDVRREEIFADAENAYVRIGRDVVIDGVELDFGLNGYRADALDAAACMWDDRILKMVKAYLCGKNKLTL